MQDVNGDDLLLFDKVRIWNDRAQRLWTITDILGNGCVMITRGLDDFGIIQPQKLVWVTTPWKTESENK